MIRHGLLRVARASRSRVVFDGEQVSADQARACYDKLVNDRAAEDARAAEAAAAQLAAYEEDEKRRLEVVRTFRNGFTVKGLRTERRAVDGRTVKVEWSRITWPDGSQSECETGRLYGTIDAKVEKVFPKRPRPMPRGARPLADYDKWLLHYVEEFEVWSIDFSTVGDPPRTQDVESSCANFPHLDVVSELDVLAQAGWTLLHVSEDRRVVRDGAASSSLLAEARYLLASGQ